MVYIAAISVIIAIIILARFYRLKRELRRIAGQLNELNDRRTEKKLDLGWYDADLELLAAEVNRQIDLTKQAVADKRRTEHELKQAISHISHDIRTPMTAILGYTQLLESEDLGAAKRAEYVGVVKNGALRLKVLLEEFFELSIIESADYPMKFASIRLSQAILDVLAGFYEAFRKKGIDPIIQFPADEVRIRADQSAVQRVLENLLINAIRHSSGNVSVELMVTPTTAELLISNPAPQLREEDLTNLFNRFYKADKMRSSIGSGLGLSIAKGLMDKMGGSLSAQLMNGHLQMRCSWRLMPDPNE